MPVKLATIAAMFQKPQGFSASGMKKRLTTENGLRRLLKPCLTLTTHRDGFFTEWAQILTAIPNLLDVLWRSLPLSAMLPPEISQMASLCEGQDKLILGVGKR